MRITTRAREQEYSEGGFGAEIVHEVINCSHDDVIGEKGNGVKKQDDLERKRSQSKV